MVETDAMGRQPVVLHAGSPYCIDDWFGGPAGTYDFTFVNKEAAGMEVYLQDLKTERIYLEVEHFGRGATRSVTASVPPGSYRWVCITDYTIKFSHPVTVTGDPLPYDVYGITPLTGIDLRIPINNYIAWLTGRLPTLNEQVAQLRESVRAGDVAAAKHDWLTAQLHYETLGGAYGAYGETGEAINGDPPRGVDAAEADFEGFRKIEAMLWSGKPVATIEPHADALIEAVHGLADVLARPDALPPIDMGRRVHEILEDTLQKDLNGIGDAGSRTELATVDANITGTWRAMDPLLPILQEQDPYLDETEQQLRTTQELVRSYHHEYGWVPLTALTTRQRAGINAAVQHCVELLSHAAVVLDPRNATHE
ncbi:imelysin family protein [Gryllotalpicola reticulitermitis]|uniref:Imelysin family protein n=1 Tax=Gryllotalpicola reticulitermitis TaxID=1184153 RepID=A0ABV8QCZ3_9MICO